MRAVLHANRPLVALPSTSAAPLISPHSVSAALHAATSSPRHTALSAPAGWPLAAPPSTLAACPLRHQRPGAASSQHRAVLASALCTYAHHCLGLQAGWFTAVRGVSTQVSIGLAGFATIRRGTTSISRTLRQFACCPHVTRTIVEEQLRGASQECLPGERHCFLAWAFFIPPRRSRAASWEP